MFENATIFVSATARILELVAVAHVELSLGAVPPDRALDEPWEDLGVVGIELPRVDAVGDEANDLGTAAGAIASWPVPMAGVEARQDPGSVKKVVYQGIDRDHAGADFEPTFAAPVGPEQQRCQRHAPDLIGGPVNVAQRLQKRVSQSG